MVVLAVETSCDETSVAVIDEERILSNVVSSQVKLHEPFGGVVPEVAARQHLRNLPQIFQRAVEEAKLDLNEIDLVAVTHGPGLIGALMVGVSFAKGLSLALEKPIVGVNHLLGHVYAAKLSFPQLEPPFLALLVSGGHTELLLFTDDPTRPELVGRTVDDAAGEAFDKVARLLQLGYPGGPAIERAARSGDPHRYHLPRAMLEKDNLDFSFSGLKTAVLYLLKDEPNANRSDVAASFQEAVVDVLVWKTLRAAELKKVKRLVLVGGVAANLRLRERLAEECSKRNYEFYVPPVELCVDNAAMIARAAIELARRGKFSDLSLNAVPYLSF
ncbi:O-sialoglycoprotein endopeptidase [Pseudothermotoga hypogea DSM 11164 = NBRC 106472]|uniref:tRNA N6-adenosine threonylcarbamoyltransferase n=2 Tax=Pseudothermotoga hypogea TaxID=57487 RepID=A0A0X1KRU7_9THEM|nr:MULTISPECIES: tRNA (adenosine(37)-N6)-threonylcarbamoyltransferase complex transferase subunit TsaD [Pseudothermotoga]AJC74027.1 O-sialoglycoprotein endopeptidase [Pseudothermotoga hypogea DSM 11164 = NBRC 106472]MBC7121780.1 tRNA (adenosine(37)-N6)-threonylcarbamoyltransferase complex transferase subunit TsaD [Pseudothermotoga sp.]MDI6863494.1 tRNA (adenosine(37)-N6)-threonylcarbamoyltransferase complex transferase subunit TsaD [Pseudothermotoga sp.]